MKGARVMNQYIVRIEDFWNNSRVVTVEAESVKKATSLVEKKPGEFVSAVMEVA